MKISNKGISLIKRFEELRLKAYKCPAGVWTVGWGHTGEDVKKGMEISEEDAEKFLALDLIEPEEFLNELIDGGIELTQDQFDALCSFIFNIGINAFKESTMLKYIKVGYPKKAAEEFDRWVYAKKKKLPGLIRRRAAEKKLFLRKESN